MRRTLGRDEGQGSASPSSDGLHRVADDLWETSLDAPAPGLTTHAYLWVAPEVGNVLFYSVASDRDLGAIERIGGVADQYLSHRDEAGPMLAELHRRLGHRLHAPVAEVAEIAVHRRPDVVFERRGRDDRGVEIVPTPGHSPGSTCFVVDGAAGRYLFTGDTLYRTAGGEWAAGYLPGISDGDALAGSLDLLAGLDPDLVVSSAFAGDTGAHVVTRDDWARAIDEARSGLAHALR
jgi:hydroxyacylglutathione hydrolase